MATSRSPKGEYIFDNVYDIAEEISKWAYSKDYQNELDVRLQEAREYCSRYCPDIKDKFFWHIILDDAIKMRRELAKLKES